MRTLVIDSATEACSVALFEHGTCLAGELRKLGRGHAEQLVPMIAALPGKGQAQRIAVGLGPGSFTGLRVGLAAARALAFAWSAELVGYPTLALIAAAARRERGGQPVAVVTTAGHGEWFVQQFGAEGKARGEALSLTPDAAVAVLDTALVAGSQAAALVALRGAGEALVLWPDARDFRLLPESALTSEANPHYGRTPDAKRPGGG